MSRHKPLIIAHRGASAHAPENTRAAIRKALTLGADMVELDVQLTKDSRLVIFHDEHLDRTTNGRGRLSHRRYHELARLDAGSWFAPRFAGERILLVSQALRFVTPPHRVNLELKRTARRNLLIRRLVPCLRWTRRLTRVLVSSFDAALLARLRAAEPRVVRALLCRDHPRRSLRSAIKLGCIAWHPHKSLVNASLVRQAHAAGLRVHVWTVDRVQEARRLLRLGVDGLVTNGPGLLRGEWDDPSTRCACSGSMVSGVEP